MNSRVAFASLFIATCLQLNAAHAESLVVADAWARASVGDASNSAAYFVLTMDGDAPDRLVAVETPLADRAELHDHLMEDGIARMRPVDAIDVLPGHAVTLEPGGLHIMLMGLTKKLEPGAMLPLTLSFEKAGEMEIELPIHPVNHRPKSHKHGDG
ncbi:MAG: copper chaperone PCu(A)C [Geminicoccaceae bacterium]